MSLSALPANLTISAIRVYQVLGILMRGVVQTGFGFVCECKHKPTCSEYAIEQIRKRGTIAGVIAGLLRILSCR